MSEMDYRVVAPEREHSERPPMGLNVKGRKSVIDYFDDLVDGDNMATSSSSMDGNSDSEPDLDGRKKLIRHQLQVLSGAVSKASSGGGNAAVLQRTDRPGGAYAGSTAAAVNHDNEQNVVKPQLSDWDKKEAEPLNSAWLASSSTSVTSAKDSRKLMNQSENTYDVNKQSQKKTAKDVQQKVYSSIIHTLRTKAKNFPREGLRCGGEIAKIIAKQGKNGMAALNTATHAAGFKKGLIGWLELHSKLKGEIIVQRNTKGGTVWLMSDAPESVRRKVSGRSRKGADSSSSSSDSDSSGSDNIVGNKVVNDSGSSRMASLDRNRERRSSDISRGGRSSLNHGGINSPKRRWRNSCDFSPPHRDKYSTNENRERDTHMRGSSSYYGGSVGDERRRGSSHGGDSRLGRRDYYGNQSDPYYGDRDKHRSISGKSSHNGFGEGSGGEHKPSYYSNSRGSSNSIGKGSDNVSWEDRDWGRQQQRSELYHGIGGSRDQQQTTTEKLDIVVNTKDARIILPPPELPPPPDRVISPPNMLSPQSQTTTTAASSDDVLHHKEEDEGGKTKKYGELPVLHKQRLKEVMKGQQEDVTMTADTLSHQQQSQEERRFPSSLKEEDVQVANSNDPPPPPKHHDNRQPDSVEDSEGEDSDSSSIYNFYASDDDDITISACSCELRRASIASATSNGVPTPVDTTNPDEGYNSDSSLRDNRPCDACAFPDPRYIDDELDDIVYCDSCNVPVHQECYDISEIPSGEWFCDVCANNIDPDETPCGFCPVIGGAMKRCKGGEEEGWAHLSCAYFIDELNVETVDGVTYVGVDPSSVAKYETSSGDGGGGTTPRSSSSTSSNKKGGWKRKCRSNSSSSNDVLLTRNFGLRNYAFSTQKCMVCKLDLQGLLISCQIQNCKAKFHASCAAHADAIDVGIQFSRDGSYRCAPVRCSRHATIGIIEGIRNAETPVTIQLKRWATERLTVIFQRDGKDEPLVGKLMSHSPISSLFCIVSEGQQVRWVSEGSVIDALGYEIIRNVHDPPTLALKSSASNPEEMTEVAAHAPRSVAASSSPAPPATSSSSKKRRRLVKNEIETDDDAAVSAAVAVAVEGSSPKGGDKSMTKPERHHVVNDEDIPPPLPTMTASSQSSSTETALLSANVNEWRFHGGYGSGRLIAGLSMATSIQRVELKTRDSGQSIYFVQPCMVSPVLHLPIVEPLCDRFEFQLEKPGGNFFVNEVTTTASSGNSSILKHKGAKIDGSSDMGTSPDLLLLNSTTAGTVSHNSADDRPIHHVRFSSKSSSIVRDPRLSMQRTSAVSRTLSSADPRVTAQPPKERTTGLGKK